MAKPLRESQLFERNSTTAFQVKIGFKLLPTTREILREIFERRMVYLAIVYTTGRNTNLGLSELADVLLADFTGRIGPIRILTTLYNIWNTADSKSIDSYRGLLAEF